MSFTSATWSDNTWSNNYVTTWPQGVRSETVSETVSEMTLSELFKALNVCFVCGADQDVFVLCDLCKEAVKTSRKHMLREMFMDLVE